MPARRGADQAAARAVAEYAEEPAVYRPIDGGWRIAIRGRDAAVTADATTHSGEPRSPAMGVVAPLPVDSGHDLNPDAERRSAEDDPRLHRRPLYPPAERRFLWSEVELERLPRMSFRPLVLAYNAPRFVFDFHTAGGLLGHLRLAWVAESGRSAWFDEWSDLDVRYVDGRMEYELADPGVPGVVIRLSVAPLAGAVGAVLHCRATAPEAGTLVWYYGGASAFFTNYSHGAPEFRFSPGQCERNEITIGDGRFALRRGFGSTDSAMEAAWAAPASLPGWAVTIRGGTGTVGCAPAEAACGDPAALLAAARPAAPQTGEVAVGRARLDGAGSGAWIVVGAGGDIEAAINQPEDAWQAAIDRLTEIGARVVVSSPDPHLDATVRMTAYSLEGTWGDGAFVHGGWSWRRAYLGWRIWYGPTCYGWTDRVARSIESHVTLGLVGEGDDRGALGSMIGWGATVFYNMNEVFLDHLRHYLDHTDDTELARRLFPVLEGIVAWESRRLQPGNEYLYENSLNTWISDSHWNTRSRCTQASAYMLAGYRLLADLAGRLGRDPEPYAATAERIREAMQRVLWQPDRGVFADCRDTTGERLLHPEPELPTIYHAAEFGAADHLQIDEMLRWADAHLPQETTAGGGRLFWSSRWYPNRGRSYTHSTYELAYAEELNYALTNWIAGRTDDAYALVRACLCGVFNGPTPGGFACHAWTDGRQRANDEFADTVSMFARAVVEGLFGIAPRLGDRVVRLSPGLPADWDRAEIRTPHFACRFEGEAGRTRIDWELGVAATARVQDGMVAVHLRLPVRASAIEAVRVDGRSAGHRVESGVGLTWLVLETAPASRGVIEVDYEPMSIELPEAAVVEPGSEYEIDLAAHGAHGYLNPQALLRDVSVDGTTLRATVRSERGHGLYYLAAGTRGCPYWLPIRLRVGAPEALRVWSPPEVGRDLSRWALVDLRSVYNAKLPDVLERARAASVPPAPPASRTGFDYRNAHLGDRMQQKPSDAAWRAKVGSDGVAWTADSIPFLSVREGPNIAVVTRVGGFPLAVELEPAVAGRALYLMVSGVTFPMQSHVTNLRFVLRYADGVDITRELVNPFDIGDCWGTWLGRFHDTAANGFENLGGRFGPEGSCAVADLTEPIAVDTEAHLIAVDLRPGVVLARLRFEIVAEDAIFGLMGASVLR